MVSHEAASEYRQSEHESVLRDLRDVGLDVRSVDGLGAPGCEEFQAAIPVLVSWLSESRSPDVKQALVRAMVRSGDAQSYEALLVECGRDDVPYVAPDGLPTPPQEAVRNTIADALRQLARPARWREHLELAANTELGTGRFAMIASLGKMRVRPEVVDTIRDLLLSDDPMLQVPALMAARGLRAVELVDSVESLVVAGVDGVREQAEQTLQVLESVPSSVSDNDQQ